MSGWWSMDEPERDDRHLDAFPSYPEDADEPVEAEDVRDDR